MGAALLNHLYDIFRFLQIYWISRLVKKKDYTQDFVSYGYSL